MKVECRLSIFKTGNPCSRPSKGTVCLAKRTLIDTTYNIVFESKGNVMKLPIQPDSRIQILKEHATAGRITLITTEYTYCINGANVTQIRKLLQDISKIMRGEQVAIGSQKPVKKQPFSGSRVCLIGNENAAQFFASGDHPNLKELTLTRCSFKKIRPELVASKSMYLLALTNCTFEPDPEDIDSFFSKFSLFNRLTLLTSLNLSGSQIPPQYICIPKTVLDINLSHNKLITYLPRSVYDHPCLQILDLKGCSLQHLSPKISNLKSLRLFDLSSNPLSHLPGSIASLRLDAFNSSSCPFEANERLCVREKTIPTLESLAWSTMRNVNVRKKRKGANEVPFSTFVKQNNWHRFIPPIVLVSGESSVDQCHTCGQFVPVNDMVSKVRLVSPLSFSNFTDSGFVPLKYDLCRRCSDFS